ncbi:GNAT family N-acetyltransferase [Streptomyces sp. Ru73]|uniref:GNAT family N-acetyltransferase n=1 Tax=Streptomyces sp. Ru73 TaxID=2080748 RepID=UPI000CDDC8C6|nr:GNAT family N-acetyltransferase [Streptomyces sp. Ru73]POX42285.1 GNAT family N-acetyltransferase [Streptomyces sp. Ru73]
MDPIYENAAGVTAVGTAPAAVAVRPARPADLDAVLGIRNDAVEKSTALWTETPQTPAEGAAWFAAYLERDAAFVAEHDGEVVGFGVYGPWRPLEGFRHSAENSVYVRTDRHGLGIGTELLTALIASARQAGYHVMIADIESGNTASIRLHERFGFEVVGTVREVGIKFGRWLDLTIMRLPL